MPFHYILMFIGCFAVLSGYLMLVADKDELGINSVFFGTAIAVVGIFIALTNAIMEML